jgi:hypothetical protein
VAAKGGGLAVNRRPYAALPVRLHRTALNNFQGTETLEEGAREAVRVALLPPGSPTGTFTRWEGETIPW